MNEYLSDDDYEIPNATPNQILRSWILQRWSNRDIDRIVRCPRADEPDHPHLGWKAYFRA